MEPREKPHGIFYDDGVMVGFLPYESPSDASWVGIAPFQNTSGSSEMDSVWDRTLLSGIGDDCEGEDEIAHLPLPLGYYTADYRFIRTVLASDRAKIIDLDNWDRTLLNDIGKSDDCEGEDEITTSIIRSLETGRHTVKNAHLLNISGSESDSDSSESLPALIPVIESIRQEEDGSDTEQG